MSADRKEILVEYDYETFPVLHRLGVSIPVRRHPYIRAIISGNSVIGTVPSFGEISRYIHRFPVPVENLKHIFRHIAGMQGTENVIYPVKIGGECIRQREFTGTGFSGDMDGGSIKSAAVLGNHLVNSGVAHNVRFSRTSILSYKRIGIGLHM